MLSDILESNDDSTAEGSGRTVEDAEHAAYGDSDVGSLVDDSSLIANDVENGVSAEGGDQVDLSKRTLTMSAGDAITGESVDDILDVISWTLIQGIARCRECHCLNGRSGGQRPGPSQGAHRRYPRFWYHLTSKGLPGQFQDRRISQEASNSLFMSVRYEKQMYPAIVKIVCRFPVILNTTPNSLPVLMGMSLLLQCFMLVLL